MTKVISSYRLYSLISSMKVLSLLFIIISLATLAFALLWYKRVNDTCIRNSSSSKELWPALEEAGWCLSTWHKAFVQIDVLCIIYRLKPACIFSNKPTCFQWDSSQQESCADACLLSVYITHHFPQAESLFQPGDSFHDHSFHDHLSYIWLCWVCISWLWLPYKVTPTPQTPRKLLWASHTRRKHFVPLQSVILPQAFEVEYFGHIS